MPMASVTNLSGNTTRRANGSGARDIAPSVLASSAPSPITASARNAVTAPRQCAACTTTTTHRDDHPRLSVNRPQI